jgi:hypothetical protein
MSPRWFCGAGLIVACTVAWATAAASGPPAKGASSASSAIYSRADFPGFDDPKTTLQEALDAIGSLYGVQFDVNEKAFKFEGLDDVLKKEVVTNPIPEMKNVRLDVLLSRILKRLTLQSGASYLVRRDGIEITTGLFRSSEVWGGASGGVPFLPLVHRKFEKVPLEEALKELSDLTDFTIVLDPRVGEKAKTPVTARFLNTPLDTAVRFLADTADLRSLQQDNMLYVTSKQNAAVWEARLRKERGLDDPLREGDPAVSGTTPRLGSGPGSIHVNQQQTN